MIDGALLLDKPIGITSNRALQEAKKIFGAKKAGHATIYVLDALTGKELWSSGETIASFNHFSGITVANGRVYLGTYDGTIWCFGL